MVRPEGALRRPPAAAPPPPANDPTAVAFPPTTTPRRGAAAQLSPAPSPPMHRLDQTSACHATGRERRREAWPAARRRSRPCEPDPTTNETGAGPPRLDPHRADSRPGHGRAAAYAPAPAGQPDGALDKGRAPGAAGSDSYIGHCAGRQ